RRGARPPHRRAGTRPPRRSPRPRRGCTGALRPQRRRAARFAGLRRYRLSRTRRDGRRVLARSRGPPHSRGQDRGGLSPRHRSADGRLRMESSSRRDNSRSIRAPRGTALSCRSWQTEAALRMLMNNLDAEVAEKPQELVVYGGIGRAARDWRCYDAIVAALRRLGDEETLLVQSGKPVGIFRTHADAPRVLIANSNLVGHWNDWEHFHELDRKGLMMY